MSLDQLHDITSPAPVSWWPLQPGWWILIVLILVVAAVTAVRWWRRYCENAWRRQALGRIRRLEAMQSRGVDASDDIQRELPVLLRRCALAAYGREAGVRFQPQNPTLASIMVQTYRREPSMPAPPDETLSEARRWIEHLELHPPC